MKVILSRKGFDTATGGIPSPIFPEHNNKMISLPIPFVRAPTRFRDIRYYYEGHPHNLGYLIQSLKGRRAGPAAGDYCHLDPDLRAEVLEHRPADWRESFGQDGSSECHLCRQEVGKGDLFLFFGLFRKVVPADEEWQYDPHACPIHTLYGWLQVEDRIPASPDMLGGYPWLEGHAHLAHGYAKAVRGPNVIYVAKDDLRLPGYREVAARGAGLLRYHTDLALTAQDPYVRVTVWDLSKWWGHRKNARFSRLNTHGRLWGPHGTLFNSNGRWQELVVDSRDYPKVINWAARLIQNHREQPGD